MRSTQEILSTECRLARSGNQEMKATTRNLQVPRRILVADNDPAIMHLVTRVFEREGYRVVSARDGRDVIRILKTDCDFAAAVFDAAMTHIQGTEMVRHMRTEKRLLRIPVMLMTPVSDSLGDFKGLTAGAAIFLPKPFTSDQLRLMLRLLEMNKGAALRRCDA